MERRLIDANALCEGRVSNDPVVIAAKCAPTIDAVEVVRCEKCLHSSSRCSGERFCYCHQWSHLVMRNHYCSCGVRRNDDGE